MDQHEKMELEVRLYVMETFLSHLWVTVLALNGDPEKLLAQRRKKMIEECRNIRLPGTDPAMSDHTSALLEDAATRLLEMQEEVLADLKAALAARQS